MADKTWAGIEKIYKHILAGLVGVILFLIVYYFFHPYWIVGNSMYPTYKNGDYVICESGVSKDNLNRNDVIIFEHDDKLLVKRIIAVPGDTVYYNKDKTTLYIRDGTNDIVISDNVNDGGILNMDGYKVEDNYFFCVGDNYNESSDCRIFGAIPYSDIYLKVKSKGNTSELN